MKHYEAGQLLFDFNNFLFAIHLIYHNFKMAQLLLPGQQNQGQYKQTYSNINESTGRRQYTPSSFIVDELLNPKQSRASLGYSRVSMRQKSQYVNTNNLYRPLKETLEHPQIVDRHRGFTSQAAQSSVVSKEYRVLGREDLQRLENNIYIPDAQLLATDHLYKVQGQQFIAVDATQRVTGPAISEAQMNRIRAQGYKESRVVYEVVEDEGDKQVVIEEEVRGEKPTYAPPAYEDYGRPEYKYNLFSCIDQPANECRSGVGCTGCPGNTVVARHNNPPSVIYHE